jgi:hypothetical protein
MSWQYAPFAVALVFALPMSARYVARAAHIVARHLADLTRERFR